MNCYNAPPAVICYENVSMLLMKLVQCDTVTNAPDLVSNAMFSGVVIYALLLLLFFSVVDTPPYSVSYLEVKF